MKCTVLFRLSSLLLVALLLSKLPTSTAFGESTWEAGCGTTVITPAQFMWMAGYGSRTHPAEGKYCDIHAKALILDDGQDHQALLITLDVVGVDRDFSQSIRHTLKQKFGLDPASVAICCSHTHSGPVVGHNLAPLHYLQVDSTQQALIDRYVGILKQRVVQSVSQAIANKQPARLAWSSAVATFAVNRRNNRASDVPRLRAEHKLKGPFDHDVPVLSIRAEDQHLLAVVFGYACHATVTSDYQWSGDYPGFAQQELEADHPGCVAMFWAGCGADQNPLPRRKIELARKYGKQLAEAVETALDSKMHELSGPLQTVYREIQLPLDTLPTTEKLEQLAESTNKYERARAEMLLEQIADGHPLDQTYPYPIGVWKFDDQIDFVFLGGEVVVDFALRLKRELTGKRTWVAGYSNDVMAYIPSLRVLREGGYEGASAMVYYGLPTTWAPPVEKMIVQTVHDMADQPTPAPTAAGAE